MTLDELIDRAVELGREEVCFNLTNEFPTRAEWEEAERQVGHLVPEAWLRFVDRFGCGQIWVAAETRIDAHSVTGEARPTSFTSIV